MEENKKPENPQAFPFEYDRTYEQDRGMTLRDYFAAKAMESIVSKYNSAKDTVNDAMDISKTAYSVADAMLKQREL